MEPGRKITAVIQLSRPEVTVQSTSNDLTAPNPSIAPNMASEFRGKENKPYGVCVGGNAVSVVATAGSVTTKSIAINSEKVEAARKQAEKRQPGYTTQPPSSTVGVSVGRNATQSILVGADLKTEEGISI